MEVDYVFSCYRCGKIIYEYQIQYGSHVCSKCGSRHMASVNLTKFGQWYCKKINNIGMFLYERTKLKIFTW